jgi:hypothetical protein
VVAVSTHNPLGVHSPPASTRRSLALRELINSVYSRRLFAKVKGNPHREQFKVIVEAQAGGRSRRPAARVSSESIG